MPVRIQRKRAKGYTIPVGARIVSRPTFWGNWITCGKSGTLDVRHVYDGGLRVRITLQLFREITPDIAAKGYAYWLKYPYTPVDCLPGLEFLADYDNGKGLPIRFVKVTEEVRKTILGHVANLRGLDLACWCPLDQPCHADVLLEIANKQ